MLAGDMIAVAALISMVSPDSPFEFGRRELAAAAGLATRNIQLSVRPNGRREEYEITTRAGKATIVGSDANGTMYGACEFAERIRNGGVSAWRDGTVRGKPFLPDRGLNLFLTLPWNYAKNDTDYDVAALTDPDRWWFQNEDYWRTLLDLMARSRLNWLDIHGTWDISSTGAPNLYAYFVTSKSFPLVGVPPEVKAQELRQLNHVIEMAHARGVRVSLMAYEANLRIPQNPNPPYKATESNVYTYTREAVEQMIRRAPGLDAIGFRIGESGHGEAFFNGYHEAVKDSGRDIPLITRSWITTKPRVLPLARASKDFTVEIKYNGEQWGAPYPVMGGRMANWGSYSFEDYLSDSGPAAANARTWPGCPAEGGGSWPSQPYKVVWQVRANGTHRIFPFYNPTWVRRSVQAMKMGTVSGYTIEGLDAYFPKSPDCYLARPADKYCDWIHQRDELWWMTWGRLGYDPSVPDATFDSRARTLLGPGSDGTIRAWKGFSTQVSKALMAYALGPDHRDHAPELEWGGDTDTYIHGAGLDTLAFEPADEELADRATGGVDGRQGMQNAANDLWHGYQSIAPFWQPEPAGTSTLPLKTERRVREIKDTTAMQVDVGFYNAVRFEDAYEAATLEAANGHEVNHQSPVDHIAPFIDLRFSNWIDVGPDGRPIGYRKPFTDRLRMHTNTFSWDSERVKLKAEAERIKRLPKSRPDVVWSPKVILNARVNLTWRSVQGSVECTVRGSGFDRAWLLVKPLPSSTFFHRVPMTRVGSSFRVVFPRERYGYAIAAEVAKGSQSARFPDALTTCPYRVIPAQPGPTPHIYNAHEAARFLDPQVLTPAKYGGLLLGTRAWAFFNSFDRATKRKLLEPVKRGLRLVILQEDFGRYKLDWLPKPLNVNARADNLFDPAGAYGLPRVELKGIILQAFSPSDGWEILGNGGLARMKYGDGEIVVASARVMQNMQYPAAARAFVALLSLGGKAKPTVLVDSCSESNLYSSSCHPDLMNSHDIPFLTLGEVVAKEQGMNSFTPIPGPRADDDVLGGKGTQIANAFLRGEVVAMAKRRDPATLAEFEVERARRKRELLRSLGLDPLPDRTPLNARITGTIARDGYRIEKLVFESRPRFFVTAHVYVPDHPAEARLPVIVHVNGHWAHKKDEDRVQLRAAFCARQGYLAIAIDSPGHSYEGDALIERRAEGDHNDFDLVEGGSNATGYYVWDAIRALDYMATRPDTDMTRVGITGASGGGLATLYAFAADDRYRAAVPVVYMASLELAPDNGCLCNHVPGTLQIGDRSDVLAIQAPKPVYLMGAQNDGEFPPEATRLTHHKLQPTWSLFGRQADTYVRIFAGGHDYNQPMREAMIGFFNRYVKGTGDGSPVPQPPLTAIDPQNRALLALEPPAPNERTMRELSLDYLDRAPADASARGSIEVNGGLPDQSPLAYRETPDGNRRIVTFESEPGLLTPGILQLPAGKPVGIRIVVSDDGKKAEIERLGYPTSDKFGCLALDILGTGELGQFELRYPVYMGRSPAFIGGWQIVRAAEAMRRYSPHIEIVARGPISTQAAMFAGIIDPTLAKVSGYGCLHRWQDVFAPGVSVYAIQPRAHLMGSLDSLRSLVKHGDWHY